MRAIGYYMADANGELTEAAFCPDCYYADEDQARLDEPIFSNTEADSPTHCGVCFELIPHALTSDGEGYVRERLAAGEGVPGVLDSWAVEWPHLAPREPEDEDGGRDDPDAGPWCLTCGRQLYGPEDEYCTAHAPAVDNP